jgi:hypothetical protein
MPVAKSQIAEVTDILLRYVSSNDMDHMFTELRETVAYKRNKSFRETVDAICRDMAKWLKNEGTKIKTS